MTVTLICGLAIATATLTLTGCETFKGMGEDFHDVGEFLTGDSISSDMRAQIDKARAQFASGDLESVLWARIRGLEQRTATQREREAAQEAAKKDRESWDPQLREQVKQQDVKQVVIVGGNKDDDTVDLATVDPDTGEVDDEITTVPRAQVEQAKSDGGFVEVGNNKGILSI